MSNSHREAYPEQYAHPLVGKKVRVTHGGKTLAEGVVQRVMSTQWGKLVDLGTSSDEGEPMAYGLWDCKEITDEV